MTFGWSGKDPDSFSGFPDLIIPILLHHVFSPVLFVAVYATVIHLTTEPVTLYHGYQGRTHPHVRRFLLLFVRTRKVPKNVSKIHMSNY